MMGCVDPRLVGVRKAGLEQETKTLAGGARVVVAVVGWKLQLSSSAKVLTRRKGSMVTVFQQIQRVRSPFLTEELLELSSQMN